jgi:biofilm PGA synthesis protein PgaD
MSESVMEFSTSADAGASRPGDGLIISAPERQSLAQRGLYASLTAFAWLAWISLWLPLITLLAWCFGLDQAYAQVVLASTEDGAQALASLMRAAVVCALLLFVWSVYNQRRYGGRERRSRVVETCPQAIADFFDAPPIVSQRLRTARRTILHVDPNGRPVRAVIPPPTLHGKALPHGSDDEHGYDARPQTVEHPERLAELPG